MFLDRLEFLAALTFLESAIPDAVETGKNCLFVRVEGYTLVFTTGGQFVTKKVIMERPSTIEESAETGKVKPLPETFMIPRADLFAFKEMMKKHKKDCKKLAKNDPSYLFVEIFGDELISYDGKVVFGQPSFEFKNLESVFQITKEPVSEILMMPPDMNSATTGFSKSKAVEITFTGPKNLVHFKQGDYEAVVLPPVEKKKTKEVDLGSDQTEID